jgi:hypothetical protein
MAECINSFDIPVKDGFDKKKTLGWQHPYLRTSRTQAGEHNSWAFLKHTITCFKKVKALLMYT